MKCKDVINKYANKSWEEIDPAEKELTLRKLHRLHLELENQLINSYSSWDQEKEELQNKNKDLEQNVQRLEQEIEEAKKAQLESNGVSQEDYNNLKNQNQNLLQQIQELQASKEDQDELKNQNNKILQQVQDFEASQEEYNKLVNQNKDLLQQIQELQASTEDQDELKNQNNKLLQQVQDFEASQEDYNKLVNQNKKLLQQIQEFSKKPKTDNQLKEAAQKIQQLENQLNEVQSHKAHFQKKLYELNKSFGQKVWQETLNNIKSLTPKVTKIQALFRGSLTRKRFHQKLIDLANDRPQKTREKSTQQAIRDVAAALRRKNLTLEQAFRAADSDSDGIVNAQEFIDFLNGLRLGLQKGTISRVLLIIDEDCSGNVNLEEFNNALEAFEVSTERHRQSARTYEQECLVHFYQLLESKQIDIQQVYSLCDTDNSGQISIKEIERYLNSLEDLQQKEIYCLCNYLDFNRSGEIDKEEFTRAMNQAKQASKLVLNTSKNFNQTQQEFSIKSNKTYSQGNNLRQSQGKFQGINTKNYQTSLQVKNIGEISCESFVIQIEQEGDIAQFFDKQKESTMPSSTFLRLLENAFPKTKKSTLKDLTDILSKGSKINIGEAMNQCIPFSRYISIKFTFTKIANCATFSNQNTHK